YCCSSGSRSQPGCSTTGGWRTDHTPHIPIARVRPDFGKPCGPPNRKRTSPKMTLATTPAPELAEPMATALSAPERDQQEGTETIEGYVAELEATMSGAIREINDINANTHLLARNARIEAARAGSAGA